MLCLWCVLIAVAAGEGGCTKTLTTQGPLHARKGHPANILSNASVPRPLHPPPHTPHSSLTHPLYAARLRASSVTGASRWAT